MTYDKASYIMHHEYNFESFFPREISHLKSTVIQNSIYLDSKLSAPDVSFAAAVQNGFGHSNMLSKIDFCPDQPGRNKNHERLLQGVPS